MNQLTTWWKGRPIQAASWLKSEWMPWNALSSMFVTCMGVRPRVLETLSPLSMTSRATINDSEWSFDHKEGVGVSGHSGTSKFNPSLSYKSQSMRVVGRECALQGAWGVFSFVPSSICSGTSSGCGVVATASPLTSLWLARMAFSDRASARVFLRSRSWGAGGTAQRWSIQTSHKTAINSLRGVGSPAGQADKDHCPAEACGCPCSSSAPVEVGGHVVLERFTSLETSRLNGTFIESSKGEAVPKREPFLCYGSEDDQLQRWPAPKYLNAKIKHTQLCIVKCLTQYLGFHLIPMVRMLIELKDT